jgi:hypothetical protein
MDTYNNSSVLSLTTTSFTNSQYGGVFMQKTPKTDVNLSATSSYAAGNTLTQLSATSINGMTETNIATTVNPNSELNNMSDLMSATSSFVGGNSAIYSATSSNLAPNTSSIFIQKSELQKSNKIMPQLDNSTVYTLTTTTNMADE